MWEEADEWLAGSRVLPEYLVLKGALEAPAVDRVRGWGYDRELRLVAGDWPAGGPLPRALEYGPSAIGISLGAGELLYLRRTGTGILPEGLRCGPRPEIAVVAVPEKIGVVVVATENWRNLLGSWLRSVGRNFLAGHDANVFLFTNGSIRPAPDLRVIPVVHSAWPGMAIRRHAIFNEHAAAIAEMDHCWYPDGRSAEFEGKIAIVLNGYPGNPCGVSSDN